MAANAAARLSAATTMSTFKDRQSCCTNGMRAACIPTAFGNNKGGTTRTRNSRQLLPGWSRQTVRCHRHWSACTPAGQFGRQKVETLHHIHTRASYRNHGPQQLQMPGHTEDSKQRRHALPYQPWTRSALQFQGWGLHFEHIWHIPRC